MTNPSNSPSGSASHHQALAAISTEKEGINQNLHQLDQQNQQLDSEEKKVEADAADVEARIRTLAEEEAQLQKKKKALQEEARAIGDWRTSLINRRKKLARDKEGLLANVAILEKRKSAIEQVQAFEETQKAASIQKASPALKTSPSEKRTNDRIAVEVEVSMHTEHNFYTGLSENLSEGGLFISTYEHLSVGTQLDVTVSLPNTAPIKAVGIVRWVRESNQFTKDVAPGIGVQFADLADEDRQTIEKFLKTRSPLFFET